MDFLKPELQTMLWTLVTFVLLLAVLWRFAWGPLLKAINAREAKIRGRFEEAEARLKEAEAKAREYEDKMAHAREQAAEIIARGRKDMEAVRQEMLEGARREAAKILERARRDINLAKDQAAQDLRDEIVRLSVEIAAKVLEKSISPEDHRRFIEECIAEYERSAEAGGKA